MFPERGWGGGGGGGLAKCRMPPLNKKAKREGVDATLACLTLLQAGILRSWLLCSTCLGACRSVLSEQGDQEGEGGADAAPGRGGDAVLGAAPMAGEPFLAVAP